MLLTGALAMAATPSLAQNTTEPAPVETPATDAIGPRELQNFSLSGNVTQNSQQPAPTAQPPAAPPATSAPAPRQPASTTPEAPQVRRPVERSEPVAAPPQVQSRSEAPPHAIAPPLAPQPQPAFGTVSPSTPLPAAAPAAPGERHFPVLPWIVAALAAFAGLGFLFWRRQQQRAAFAGAAPDYFAAPEPLPQPPAAPQPRAMPSPPRPAPAPPAAAPKPAPEPVPPASSGIVASRLRPAIEIGVQPLRCVVDDQQVTIEFALELYNAGTAPARAVLAEAVLVNAGASQEEELGIFFRNPVGAGERIDLIAPMSRLAMTSRVTAPRGAVQEYEIGGHRSFVPLVAFNALYEFSGRAAQTSAAYLVGRDTGGEKLGPLRLDLGERQFSRLGARLLPTGLKT